MTKVLIEYKGMGHNAALFPFEYKDYKGNPATGTGYIFDNRDDLLDPSVYLMQKSVVIKSEYTQADRDLIQRIYHDESPVKHGDIVKYDGDLYQVRILGNYSDAGRLIKVEIV